MCHTNKYIRRWEMMIPGALALDHGMTGGIVVQRERSSLTTSITNRETTLYISMIEKRYITRALPI